jgi:hypothetical protein
MTWWWAVPPRLSCPDCHLSCPGWRIPAVMSRMSPVPAACSLSPLSCPFCHVLKILPRLPRPGCTLLTVMTLLSCSRRSGLSICQSEQSMLTCQSNRSKVPCPSCPVPIILLWQSCHSFCIPVVLSWLAYPYCHVLAILSSLSCPGCPEQFVPVPIRAV